MSNVTVVQSLNTTPAKAWALLGNPGTVHAWHPAIANTELTDDRRTIILPDGAKIHEQIVSHDDQAMRYRYTIVEAPLPVKDYVGILEVVATADGAEARWSASYEALAPEADVEAMLRGLYASGLEAARAQLEA